MSIGANFTAEGTTFNYKYTNVSFPSTNQGDLFNLTASNDMMSTAVSALVSQLDSVACQYNFVDPYNVVTTI